MHGLATGADLLEQAICQRSISARAHHSCHPQTTRRINGHAHPGDHLAPFCPNLVGLHLVSLHLPLFNDGLMHALALLPCPPLPGSYRAFIQPIRVHNGLDGTSVGQQAHHDHDQLRWRAQSFQHGSPSCIKGALAHPTAIAIWSATMNPHVARSEFASCRTRRVRAKLVRRVHRLWCTVLHTHIMPRTVDFFKPPPPISPVSGVVPEVQGGLFLLLAFSYT